MEKLCPLLKKPCIEHQCKFYGHVQGKNPQTGADLDHWDCVITMMPLLIIEVGQQTRQAGAAIESLRNAHAGATAALIAATKEPPKLEG